MAELESNAHKAGNFGRLLEGKLTAAEARWEQLQSRVLEVEGKHAAVVEELQLHRQNQGETIDQAQQALQRCEELKAQCARADKAASDAKTQVLT